MKHYLSVLEDSMRRDWDRVCLSNYGGEDFTFCDLASQIEKFHLFFDKVGVKKGEKIALCASNSARWAMTFLAVNTYEAVIVPLLSDFHPDNVNTLVDHSESIILFTDKETWPKLDIAKMPRVVAVIAANDFSLLWSKEESIAEAYAGIEAAFAAKYPEGFKSSDVHYPTDNLKDLAVINYTSGTTSSPKGVMLRYECFCASVDFGLRRIPCSNEDNIVSMLPMGHIYGLVFEFLYPLCGGVHVTYLGKSPAASTLLRAMGQIKPYLVITVPLVMEKVFKSSIKPVLDKPVMKVLTSIPGISTILYGVVRKKLLGAFGGNVQQFIMGGAALNPEVEKVFKKMKFPFTVGYGMTEAAPLLAYSAPKDFALTSCGHYVDFCEVRIDSEDPEHIAGEIQAKGQNICSGYFNNPEASENAFTEDGFLRTGDLGIMDKKGNVFIKGRSKSMILSANGQNIYPEELEAVINSQEYVIESVVVDRAGKLVGLVYFDSDAMKKAGMTAEDIDSYRETLKISANKLLPSYSKLATIEAMDKPFEKTPKMSIKRFMYK